MAGLPIAVQQPDHAETPDFDEAEDTGYRALLGLYLALNHPALSSDPQVLCAAARACKAWREAVQQCGACNTAVVLNPTARSQHQQSFCRWLRKHALLVRSIRTHIGTAVFDTYAMLKLGAPGPGQDYEAEQLLRETMQLLSMLPPEQQPEAAVAESLPTSRAAAASAQAADAVDAVAAGTLGAGSTASMQQQDLWHLASYSSDCFVSPATLAALPAHSLTHLDLDLTCSIQVTSAAEKALPAALARLNNLQQLRLASTTHHNRSNYNFLVGSCLAGVAQLTRLTSLRLEGQWRDVAQPLQDLLAVPLPLQQLQLQLQVASVDRLPALSLAHLTQLTQLSSAADLHDATVLPAQLQRLRLDSCSHSSSLQAVLALQQLRHLQLSVGFQEPQPLLRLALLPALQHVALEYTGKAADAAGTAGAWAQMGQLRALKLHIRGGALAEQLKRIIAGVDAATSITKLDSFLG